MENFKDRVNELVKYVKKYPEFIGEIMEVYQSFDLVKVRELFNNLDITVPYTKLPTYEGYLRNKEDIDRIIMSKDAYTVKIEQLDQDYINDYNTKDVYGKIAHIYNEIMNRFWPFGRDEAMTWLSPLTNEKILEIGIGPGMNFKYYPNDCIVVGIDFTEQMIKLAKEEIERTGKKNISVYNMDAHQMTFSDSTFDKVYSFASLSTVRNPFRVMKEVKRVCKDGGIVVFLEPIKSNIKEVALLQYLLQPIGREIGEVWIKGLPAYTILYHSFLDLFAILEELGFKVKKDKSFDPYSNAYLIQCINKKV